jgi:hypothetical protein
MRILRKPEGKRKGIRGRTRGKRCSVGENTFHSLNFSPLSICRRQRERERGVEREREKTRGEKLLRVVSGLPPSPSLWQVPSSLPPARCSVCLRPPKLANHFPPTKRGRRGGPERKGSPSPSGEAHSCLPVRPRERERNLHFYYHLSLSLSLKGDDSKAEA